MFFKKFYYFIVSFVLMFFIFMVNFVNYYSVNFSYFSISQNCSNNYSFNFLLDFSSFIFLFMLFAVTCLVSLYSEVYMEFYNNKKFIFLMVSFFFTMIFLSLSSSLLNLMIGWDGLGITSICLIMFYPNKMTSYNSILTMFFNRLGDVVLIVLVSIFFANWSLYYFYFYKYSFFMLVMILLCSFTKSAQFPLSSWLPAAMAAPTPISAMVHSSTLVTAGIFFIHKVVIFMVFSSLLEVLLFISILTFILGGLMGNLELDLKKIVAFSTMSQISLILFFCSLTFIFLALSHMIFHAFFKTFLFCSSGLIFLFNFSWQNLMVSSHLKYENLMYCFLFFSIYSMSGFIFSSSFFSKDLMLEILNEMTYLNFFFILLTGSLLTLYYSSGIMNSSFSWFNFTNAKLAKSFGFLYFFIFLFIVLYINKFIKYLLFLNFFPLIFWLDIFFSLFFLFIPFFVILKMKKEFFFLSLDISFMKVFLYNNFCKFFNKKSVLEVSFTDSFFFKEAYFNLALKIFNSVKTNSKSKYMFDKFKNYYFLFFFFFLFF